jgi:hypothetical protein
LVISPNVIPQGSVESYSGICKIFKGCGLSGLNERHKYILRFDIRESDIQLILNSDKFREIGYVEYDDGIIRYGEVDGFKEATTITYDDDGNVISTYHRASDVGSSFKLFFGWYDWFPPRWFEFDKWNTFKAYVVKINRVGYCLVRLLVYNQDIGQAYFIEYETRGL